MTDGIATSATTLTVGEGGALAEAAQAQALVVGIYPSQSVRSTQAQIVMPIEADMLAEVAQVQVLVVGEGRIRSPKFKVWTFTMDDHDYYVLHIGFQATLIYDVSTGEWTDWGTADSATWRLATGCNWSGATGVSPGSAVVGGDNTLGVLYFLDPNYPYDDNPFTGAADKAPFYRVVQGQIVHRDRDPLDCYGVSLTGSFGDVLDVSLTDVTLSYSDDAGRSYIGAGTITADVSSYAPRIEWRSLGCIKAPGRLFKIEDYGALARIDSLDLFDAGS